MKNFKKLMMLAAITLINQQFMIAEYKEKEAQSEEISAKSSKKNKNKKNKKKDKKKNKAVKKQQKDKDKKKDKKKEKHQGFGRIWTAAENTLTLHPGNAVNALATGDQDDTTFGYERNDEGRVKARQADTHRNRKNEKKENEKSKKSQAKKESAE